MNTQNTPRAFHRRQTGGRGGLPLVPRVYQSVLIGLAHRIVRNRQTGLVPFGLKRIRLGDQCSMFEIDAVSTTNLQKVAHLDGQPGRQWAILLAR